MSGKVVDPRLKTRTYRSGNNNKKTGAGYPPTKINTSPKKGDHFKRTETSFNHHSWAFAVIFIGESSKNGTLLKFNSSPLKSYQNPKGKLSSSSPIMAFRGKLAVKNFWGVVCKDRLSWLITALHPSPCSIQVSIFQNLPLYVL